MRKPKLNVGQECFFAIFCDNDETGRTEFTVNSGRVRAIEFYSETDEYIYYVESPFIVNHAPDRVLKLLPKKLWICRMMRRIYFRLHRSSTQRLEEVAVFHDIRDCIEDSHDFANIVESMNCEETHGSASLQK